MNKPKQIKIDYHLKLKIISYADNKSWNEAQAWAKKQGGRVPTVEELQILSVLQRTGKLDTKLSGHFWSSEEGSDSPQYYGRNVHLNYGYVYGNLKYCQAHAICVKDI